MSAIAAVAALAARPPKETDSRDTTAVGNDEKKDDATVSAAAEAFAGALSSALMLVAPGAAPADGTAAAPTDAAAKGNAAAPADRGADAKGKAVAALDQLAPEFREKLERVMERMKSEFGHDVRVTETLRSPARQEALFEQGRTRPGPVVTWTLDSQHLTGAAADLLVDGSYDAAEGYRHLAQIAREEGLRTLGAADPGHVELARGAVRAAAMQAPASGAPDVHGGLAQVAQVAQVAAVAPVAQIATVAQVAQVGQAADLQTPIGTRAADPKVAASAVDGGGAPATTAAPAVEAQKAGADQDSTGPDADGNASSDRPVDARAEARETLRHDVMVASPPPAGSDARAATGATALRGTDIAERIARVLQLQTDASARTPTSMLLRLDGAGNGGDGFVRVDLRGARVGTAIGLRDPAAASRAQATVGELQRALDKRGLTADSIDVRTLATEAMERVGAARTGDPAARALPRDPSADGRHAPRDGRHPDARSSRQDDTGHERPRSRRTLTGKATT
jgi:uncharacterized protein YcbK (DUF882 family)